MTRERAVYVIRFGVRDHKIGFSNNPERRRRQLGPEAGEVVWACSRPRGDASAVEALAHRFLAEWRRPRQFSERFRVSSEAACAAVRLAAQIIDDNRAGMWPPILLPPPAPTPAPVAAPVAAGPGIVIGYGEPQDMPLLAAAGVQPRRIYTGGRPGLMAARRACRAGDTLLMRLADAETVAAVTAKGATVRELAA